MKADVESETMTADEAWKALPEGEYAILELFGHTTLVGRVNEVERFGAKMLALEPLFNDTMLPPVFHGGAAIYRMTPCDRRVAWKNQPRNTYQLPASIRVTVPPELLPAPAPEPQGYDEQDDE